MRRASGAPRRSGSRSLPRRCSTSRTWCEGAREGCPRVARRDRRLLRHLGAVPLESSDDASPRGGLDARRRGRVALRARLALRVPSWERSSPLAGAVAVGGRRIRRERVRVAAAAGFGTHRRAGNRGLSSRPVWLEASADSSLGRSRVPVVGAVLIVVLLGVERVGWRAMLCERGLALIPFVAAVAAAFALAPDALASGDLARRRDRGRRVGDPRREARGPGRGGAGRRGARRRDAAPLGRDRPARSSRPSRCAASS